MTLSAEQKQMFNASRVLVTGGTGSIGQELVKQIAACSPRQLRVFSNDEHALYQLEGQYKDNDAVRCLIGDVRDSERMRKAASQIDYVFHAAALKHVPLCEHNPFEAIRTNVLGTQNVLEAALDMGAKKVIVISTDKAAAPVNVMGATKLLSEKLATSAVYYQGDRKTQCCAVRFGNVLGSRGSVLETFERQIQEGGPVTLTDPRMNRFIMTIRQAASLVLSAAHVTQGSEVFVLKMPCLSIADLVQAFIEVYAPKVGRDPKSIEIVQIQPRPGEKLDELLMTKEEADIALENETMFILRPFLHYPEADLGQRQYSGTREANLEDYSSADVKKISQEEIKTMLADCGY